MDLDEDILEDSFEITEERDDEIISFDELLDKIDYQFRFEPELGQDKRDYMKYYFTKVLGCKKENFPENYSEVICDENRKEYGLFMHKIEYNMKYNFGIKVDDNSDNYFEILYNLYNFLVVEPESFIVDYLLYYHMYKEGYNINEYFKKNRIKDKLILDDMFEKSPVNQVNSQLDYYYKQRKENEKDDIEIGNITYQERFDTFIKYAKEIFDVENDFNFYEIFEKLNTINPCNNYELLNDEISIFNSVRIESNELIVDQILRRNFDVDHLEEYINKNLLDPFFKYLANLENMVNSAMFY